MRGSSKAFQSAVVTNHISICRVDIIRDGRVVERLNIHKGQVTADKTAAQLRNFDVEVSDPDKTLTPDGMASLLAPFGTRMQLWRGIRFENIGTLRFYANSPAAWQVITPQGQMNGVVADPSTGELRMGP